VAATLLRSQFKIRQENTGAALVSLKDWATHWVEAEERGYADPHHDPDWVDDLCNVGSLDDAFYTLGWDPVWLDGDIIGLYQHTFDNVDEMYEAAMAALHGIVEPRSYMIFHGDDDDLFRWAWEPNGFYVGSNGRIVFDNDSTNFKVDPWK
jgi:hypothetical protein